MTDSPPKYKRRWFRFTLRSFLVAVTLFAVWFGWEMHRARERYKRIATEFNLNTLRAQIELFKAQHGGTPPAYDATNKTITGLTTETIHNGFSYGPYLVSVPVNSVTSNSTVALSATAPITAAKGNANAGWIYHPATGEIRIDHADHSTK